MQKRPSHITRAFSPISPGLLFLGYFSLAWNSSLWIFCDEDLIRSSNRRNSAVSSAIDLGGGLEYALNKSESVEAGSGSG
jgi:hypothetical protein